VTKRHTHAEFLDFLNQLNRAYRGWGLRLAVENLWTHTHARAVACWINTRTSTCTLPSPMHCRLNQVELWLSILTRRYL
jgi:hypothetical protein